MVDLADGGGLKGPRTRFVTFPTLRKLKSAADKPDYRLPILFLMFDF
jgi:hypothetical protein